jgi:Uma2 family endonuclease
MVQQATLPPLVRGRWYPMSWEEFLDWSPSEGQAEWVEGRGIAYVSNSTLHGGMVGFLGQRLGLYTRVFGLGEVFFDNVLLRLPSRPSGRMPDVMVVPRDRIRERWVEGAALFAAEFVSEDSVHRDTVEKLREFEREGVPEYLWVEARPGRRDFRFHRLAAEGEYLVVEPDSDGRYHSEALPGFWFRPEWFWQESLPDPDRLMLRIAPEAYRRYLTQLLEEPSGE